jgi:hypothetical protein
MATRRRRNKKVSAKETVQQQEPVVIETPVEVVVEQPVAQQETVVTEPVKEEVVTTPVAEETTQDSSKKEKEYVIAKPMLFTGDIKDLIPDGMNNGLNNPALEIPQQWQQQNIQQPQPVQQTIAQVEVQNPQAMGSEQKAALEQSIQAKKEEEAKMVKQDQLDQINETKIEKQEAEQMEQVNKLEALIGAKIAEAGNAQQEEKSLKDAFVEGAVIGIGAGVGTVAGIYVADKAIGAFEEWRNTKDAAEETSKLISGLL